MSIATTMTSVSEPERSILRASQHSRSSLTPESAARFARVLGGRSNSMSGPNLAHFGSSVSMAKPFGADGLFGAHATPLRSGFGDYRGGGYGSDEFDAGGNLSRKHGQAGFDRDEGGAESPLSGSDYCDASLENASIACQTSQSRPDAAICSPPIESRTVAARRSDVCGARVKEPVARTVVVAKSCARGPLPSVVRSDCALSLYVESHRVDVQARIGGLTSTQAAEFDRRARTELAAARLGVRQVMLNGQPLPQGRRS